jgi:hypothetical protein
MIAAGAAMLLLVAIGGGAWWFLQPSPEPEPALLVTKEPSPPAQVADAPAGPPPAASGEVASGPPAAPAPAAPSNVPAAAPAPAAESNAPDRPGQGGQPAEAERQPPPAPGVQAPNPRVAIANLDALRRQVAQWVSSRSCAVLGGDLADGALAINGYADNRSIEELRQGLTSFVPPGQIEWRVKGVDRVFCVALNLLHPITPGFGAAGETRLGLRMADGKTRLRDGERIRVRLVMPAFAGRLRVDYLAHDGSVQHLYPQLADPKVGITADPPRTYRPGEEINLADPVWVIGPPYGTDMIIAIASSDPLFERPRPSNAELADDYLLELQAATDRLRLRGARLAGAAITLEALQ